MWLNNLKRKKVDPAGDIPGVQEPVLAASTGADVLAPEEALATPPAFPDAAVDAAAVDLSGGNIVTYETAAVDAEPLEVTDVTPEPVKAKGRFGFARRNSRGGDKRRVTAVPIRVFIGHLPDVTERDARDYALGVAEKHFDQPAIEWFDAFKYGEGFAYEVHEGGDGVAYLPEIIKLFNAAGPFRVGERVEVVIRTGTRMVKVLRQRTGLQAVLLPESAADEPTDGLSPSVKLSPALNQRTGLLVAGATFFVASFFALIVTALMARYQPYDPAPPPVASTVNFAQLPISQWPNVQGLPSNEYVSKLAYEKGSWLQPVIQSADAPAAVPAATALAAPGMSPAQGVAGQPSQPLTGAAPQPGAPVPSPATPVIPPVARTVPTPAH